MQSGDQRKTRRIELLESNTLRALLAAEAPAFLSIYKAATLPPNEPLLFADYANEEIRREHLTAPDTSSVGLAIFPNALVSGPSIVGSHEYVYLLAPLVPFFVDHYIANGWLPPTDMILR